MAYNTGNPIGSTSPKDLLDNAEILDKFSNGDAYEYFDRLGRKRKSMKWIQDAALAIPAIDAAIRSEQQANRSTSEADRSTAARVAAEVARDAAQLSVGIFDTTALGLAGTTSGKYFSVPSPESIEFVILYKNTGGTAVEVKRYLSAAVSSVSINAGKPYPLKAITRDGALSTSPAQVVNGILDIKVIGAQPGMLYRLEWIANGTTAIGGVATYQLLFAQYVKANYATSSATGMVQAINLGDIPATTVESGDIITRTFVSPRIDGLSFVVTYRPSALPANGFVALNVGVAAGYSWIIDENCYFRTLTGTVPVAGAQDVLPVAYSISGATDRELQVAFRLSSVKDMRLTLRKLGVNATYNSVVVDVADHGGTAPSLARTWTNISTGGSDWFGPYRVRAVANGDGGAEAFTGGAHGANGDATGAATAKLMSVEIAVDGTILGAGNVAGTCREIVMTWINRVQGYNTKTTVREILEETINLRISPGSMQVHGEFQALEAIEVLRYYGLQAMANGFQSSIHFVGGQQAARFTPVASTDYNSGAKSAFPSIPLIGMRSTTGEFWMWLDQNYGLGAARVVDAALPIATYSQYFKSYHTLVYAAAGLALGAGASRKWRGGYAWGQNLISPDAGADTALRYDDGRSSVYGLVRLSAGTSKVSVAPRDRNVPVTHVSGTGDSYTSQTLDMTGPGYGLTLAKV